MGSKPWQVKRVCEAIWMLRREQLELLELAEELRGQEGGHFSVTGVLRHGTERCRG